MTRIRRDLRDPEVRAALRLGINPPTPQPYDAVRYDPPASGMIVANPRKPKPEPVSKSRGRFGELIIDD